MKILEQVNGTPIVLAETETHLFAVRNWPARPSALEFVIWAKDLGGGLSSGSYFPVYDGDGTEEFLNAVACYVKRARIEPKPPTFSGWAMD